MPGSNREKHESQKQLDRFNQHNKKESVLKKIFSLSSVFIFGIITAILLASCATIFHGSTDTVSFSSDPSASKVYVNGNLLGTTPVQLQLKSKNSYTLEFKKDGFEKNLNGDFSLSTELVDYLVLKDVPFRQAHHIVGNVVAVCVEQNKKLDELSLSDYKIISPKFENDVFKLLTSRSSVQNKKTKGSTSPAEVQKQISFWKKILL